MVAVVNDAVLDAASAVIRDNCNKIVACVGTPASFSEANTNLGSGSGKKVAEATVASGDFTLAAGTGGGQRRITLAAKTGSGVVSGNPTTIAFLDTTNSRLLAVTDETGSDTINVGSNNVFFPSITLNWQPPTNA